MSQDIQTINIQLLNKTLQIRCPEEKISDLQKAARMLDTKMHEIVNTGKSLPDERIAIMGAIQVIYDLITQQSQKDIYIDSLSSRIRELQNKIALSITQDQEIGL